MSIRTMKKVICMAVALTGISVASAFDYEQTLLVGKYRGTTTLSGFPVLVRISQAAIPGFDYSQFQLPDGGDLAFETPEGVVCPHEIESWNPDGESLVWVRLPVLAGTSTKFVMRWGDSSATPPATSRDVWDETSGGFYAGVWHFGETIASETAASTSSADSALHDASLDMKATPVQYGGKVFTSEMVSTNGVVGHARVNQLKATDYYFQNGGNSLHVASYDQMSLGDTFTISGWFRLYDYISYPGLVNRETNFGAKDGWSIFGYYTWNDHVGYRPDLSGSYAYCKLSSGTLLDHWTHVVAVYDGTKFSLYLDGIQRLDETAIAAFGDNGKELVFGLWYSAMAGSYDEIRLHSEPLPKDWVQAEYDSIAVADYVSAVVTPAKYVSAFSGSDLTGDGTSGNPFATIGHAVSVAADGDEVRVEEGIYEESVTIPSASKNLTIRGGYAANWKQDLASCRTVIVPTDAANPCVLVDGAPSVILRGLTLTGGTYGVLTQNGCNDFVAEQLIVTNCTSGGLKLAGNGQIGVRQHVRNCYVADNVGYGIEENTQSSVPGSELEISNTTVVRNAGGIKNYIAKVFLANSVIGEQESGFSVDVGSGALETRHSCIWNGALTAFNFYITASWDYYMYYMDSKVLQVEGTLRDNPLLADDGALGAGSPCLRRGAVSALDNMIERRDVYGRVWGTTPDMGCFKSEIETPIETESAEIFVAADGDDANAGTSAAAPLRSLALGVHRTSAGGTLHVGEGTYSGPVILDKPGLRFEGAGAASTEIVAPEAHESAIVVCATGVSVKAVAATSGFIGVQQIGPGTGVVVEDAVLRNNTRGFSSVRLLESADAGTIRLRASVVTNNAAYGIQFFHNSVVGDNLLIVRNGRDAAYSAGVASGATSGSQPVWLYNCTIADNVGHGIFTGRSYGTALTHDRNFVNCIVSGNSGCGYSSYDAVGAGANGVYGNFLNCLVNGNGTDFGRTPETNVNPVEKPVCFSTRSRSPYHLSSKSPAIAAGIDVNDLAGAQASYDDDLDHQRRHAWDLGCYAYNPSGLILIVK